MRLFPRSDVRRLNNLTKYVSPEVLTDILDGVSDSEPSVKNGLISFILIQVRDDNLETISLAMETATEVIIKCGARMEEMMSPLILATIGIVSEENINNSICSEIGEELIRVLPRDIKAVVGKANGFYGITGPPLFQKHGPLLPSLSKNLKILADLEFGQLHRA